ncbi:substrate-binding domain-containing protein [Clostridium psychrophilum]|uniref:substrate-binding domain-containing protein n=1 Tax=Clostridium psychrophilum TaxID=132926 RepID=UPI001C0BE626|nr:substrate-binding domain-containing protein [Clostridium psychrophilum]MBU3182912.1 substrate-binding domain-containing protein [Clostridium psychrophilum]
MCKSLILSGYIKLQVYTYKAIIENKFSIGRDISIVGFDDIEMVRFMVPAMTTVKVYTEFMGEAAVDLLLERFIKERSFNKKVVIPTKLMIRDSCGKI